MSDARSRLPRDIIHSDLPLIGLTNVDRYPVENLVALNSEFAVCAYLTADHQAVHAVNKALKWAELSFVRMTRVRPLSTNHRHRGNGLGNTTFRFLCSLTSRSALRLYSASRSNSKNSTRSSGGSILAVAKLSLSCSMSVLSFSVTASPCPSDNS